MQRPSAARYRRGERPSLQEYIDRCPDLADEIREMFPALVAVEQADQDQRKFDRMLEFGAALPRIRATVRDQLARPGLGRDRVLAAAIRLIDLGFFRPGGEEYAAENGTFGLATIRRDALARFSWPTGLGCVCALPSWPPTWSRADISAMSCSPISPTAPGKDASSASQC